MEIENRPMKREEIRRIFCEKDDAELMAQDIVVQGAIHAVSFLLMHGCTEKMALEMLSNLREQAVFLREEAAKRDMELFKSDQTGFS